jgi:hypothetical protein
MPAKTGRSCALAGSERRVGFDSFDELRAALIANPALVDGGLVDLARCLPAAVAALARSPIRLPTSI